MKPFKLSSNRPCGPGLSSSRTPFRRRTATGCCLSRLDQTAVLVLADEPTGNLDASYAVELGRNLARLCLAGEMRSLIIATHNENLARLCDRTLVLNDGKLSERVSGVLSLK